MSWADSALYGRGSLNLVRSARGVPELLFARETVRTSNQTGCSGGGVPSSLGNERERERESANIFGNNLGFAGKHAQETASVFSGIFNAIFQTHFWQNSKIRNRVFQKQHAICI